MKNKNPLPKLSDAVYELLINVKMLTTAGILIFMGRLSGMFSWVEHERNCIPS